MDGLDSSDGRPETERRRDEKEIARHGIPHVFAGDGDGSGSSVAKRSTDHRTTFERERLDGNVFPVA